MSSSWFPRFLAALFRRSPRHRPAHRGRRQYLRIELLEDRTLPSIDPLSLAALRGVAGDDLVGKDGPLIKAGFDLAYLHAEFQEYCGCSGPFQSTLPLIITQGNSVRIEAIAAGNVDALVTNLQQMGLTDITVHGLYVNGWLPINAIPAMASLSNLKYAMPVYAPITNTGFVTSQGDAALRADVARATLGVTGAGVTVGVLSDSFNTSGNGSYAIDQIIGVLPPGINVIQDTAGTDEGRAMLQLIHDVAPGAALAFATASLGVASFANNITALAAAGANVIVDDITYLNEPFFQDGPLAQTVDTVVASGVAYFSSAGNSARNSYERGFVSGGILPAGSFGSPLFRGGEVHDFNPSAIVTDITQSISIPAGQTIIIGFQWDQPFFSVSGFPGAATDMDIYLVNAAGTAVLAAATTNNILAGDPLEILVFTNTTGTTLNANLVISRFFGLAPNLMKYVIFRGGTINEYATNSSTVIGHHNAAGTIAVGAAFYQQTPVFGVNPPVIEPFSSAGGTRILFTTTGQPTNIQRQRPDVVGPDGTDNSFFGVDVDGTGWPNFFGTSAAAPHVAAVAALMLQANPSLTPDQIRNILRSTAIDMDDPFTPTFDVGFDFGTGFGFVDALRAVQAAISPGPSPGGNTIFATGTDQGGGPHVRVFDSATGALIGSFFAYNPAFTGGVRVAVGDVTGDGQPEIITAPGPGGGPHIRIFTPTGQPLGGFFAYSPSFTGGVYVAVANVTGNNRAEIITGAGAGGGPHVIVRDGVSFGVIHSFFAFVPSFTGGVRVAGGDLNGDGRADIVVAAGPGGGPHVRAFSGANLALLHNFFAYSPLFSGGVHVAVGAVTGTRPHIITGAGANTTTNIRIFDGISGLFISGFSLPSNGGSSLFEGDRDAAARGEIRVAVTDRNGDGRLDIIVGLGASSQPRVRIFDALSLNVLDDFFAYDPNFRRGIFVGG
ncbi:MAG: S8 family serine peptidase [Gemmataceae bacterium]